MLSVEQFAVLRAQMEGGRPRDEVLRDARLPPAAWVQLQRHWLSELARASSQRSSDLASRYQAAFAGAGGGAASAAPATPLASAPAVPTVPDVVVAPAPVVPSYLRAAAITPVSPQGPLRSYLSSPVAPQVMIHVPTAHAPPHAAPPLAPVARVPLAQRGTMAVFSTPTAGGPPPSATPFVEGTATSKRPIDTPRDAPTSSERRAAPTGKAPVSDERPRPAFTGTALATGEEGVALPFGPTSRASVPLPDGVPAMSLEQYAWLSATLKSSPAEELPAVLAKVRLTVQTRQSLESYWRARFEAEPALRQAFMPLFAKFVAKGTG